METSDTHFEKKQQEPYRLTGKQKRYLPVKRALDICICLPVCILLAPFMLIIAAVVKMDSPGPVFFKQKRIGRDKTTFHIWKFRTMRVDTPRDMPTHLLHNPEAYITKTGRFLRLYSIDEFPQFYQTLFGVTSLVGPRAALWNQDDLVAERDKYGANAIKPGITGWAQIHGRDELDIEEKAKYDGDYVKHMGFLLDVVCFFGTFLPVLKQKGVVEGGTGELRRRAEMSSGNICMSKGQGSCEERKDAAGNYERDGIK